MNKVFLFTFMFFLYVCFSPVYSSEPSPTPKPVALYLNKNPEILHSKPENPLNMNNTSYVIKNISVDQKYEVGPIQLTIQTVNIMHCIPSDLQKPPFDVIEINWEIFNTAEEDFLFTPIQSIKIKNGGQLTNKLPLMPGDIMGWESKYGTSGFIIDDSQTNSLTTVNLHTGDIYNVNNRRLVEGRNITFRK